MQVNKRLFILAIILLQMLPIWAQRNIPYPASWERQKIVFAPFTGAPKTLDPAKSYSTDSNLFVSQICEPILEYDYLIRPYKLKPLAASVMPVITYLDANFKPIILGISKNPIAYTRYDIDLRQDLVFAPHPALAVDKTGHYLYHSASFSHWANLAAYPHQGTRAATAADFVYQIKRLASPKVNSPIYGVMAEHIVGFKQLNAQIQALFKLHPGWAKKDYFLDLRAFELTGVKATAPYHVQILLKGQYRQFIYWLAMPFFSPMPWEVDAFYSLPGQAQNNIGFDWAPMGTGPYQLVENNPNQRMILAKNPNYHADYYPSHAMPGDQERGYLRLAGKRLPIVDRFVFSLEKESVASWNKFLQGYYDRSGVTSDNFDDAISISGHGQFGLSRHMLEQGIRLDVSVSPGMFYIGFNMYDSVVGGYSDAAKKLRQAISIAIDYEEFITIFLNGRGVAAQGPIPPNIWGYVPGKAGINPYIYRWQGGHPVRRSLQYAKQLLAQAGYPGGTDPETGRPLLLHYDVMSTNGPDDKARFSWMREQFAKLGIALDIRATQYNRFQDKMRRGHAQIYTWGWLADYPDPENFLFLLYGPNGKVKYHGENASNYENKNFDACFEKVRNLIDGPARQLLLNQCVGILQQDAPWVWGYYPKTFILAHQWMSPIKPGGMISNILKYYDISPKNRTIKQHRWNKPHWWALIWAGLLLVWLIVWIMIKYKKTRQARATDRY